MPNFKVNYLFEGMLNTGWDETVYTVAADYTTAKNRALALADNRGELTGVGISLVDVRVSDDAIIGDSMTSGPVVLNPEIKTEGADVSWTAAQMRCVSGTLYRRTWMLRGIPDYLFSSAADVIGAQTDWRKAFNRFANKLISLGFSIKAKARGGDQPQFAIKSVEQLGVAGYKVNTFLPHGLVQGDKVFIYNMKEAPSLKGERTVALSTGATSFEVDTTPNPVFTYKQKAYVRKIVYIYPAITGATYIRIARRATGRPFGLFRGRAR